MEHIPPPYFDIPLNVDVTALMGAVSSGIPCDFSQGLLAATAGMDFVISLSQPPKVETEKIARYDKETPDRNVEEFLQQVQRLVDLSRLEPRKHFLEKKNLLQNNVSVTIQGELNSYINEQDLEHGVHMNWNCLP